MSRAIENVDFLRNFKARQFKPANQGYQYRQLIIDTDGIDGTDGAVGKVDALFIRHGFGGAGAKGGRHGLEIEAYLSAPTSPTNPDRNYVGAAIVGRADSSDGGTAGVPKGAVFGINPVGTLNPGATFFQNVTSGEHNVAMRAGSSALVKSGISIVAFNDDAVRGSVIDTSVSLSNQAGAVGFTNGLLFHDANGAHPVAGLGTLIATRGAHTVTAGIDFSSYTFTAAALKTPGFSLAGTGSLEVGPLTSATTPFINFHSSGINQAYDSRLLASGGAAGVGLGNLVVDAAEFQVSGTFKTGTFTGSADVPVIGYITQKDNTGVARKLAVIA